MLYRNIWITHVGMGSKSGLSYQSHFFINTHVNGTTYNYIYRKGQIEPELDLLDSYKEDRRNGTEIKLKIKSESDLITFVQECNRQLYYFENVVFDYENILPYFVDWRKDEIKSYLNNDFKIYEGKTFRVRINNNTTNTKIPFGYLHMTNGPVAYPIDWSNFGYKTSLHNISVALKFGIGELDIIQTREDVRYTDKTKKAIENKLKEFQNELVDLASQDLEKICNTIPEYVSEYALSNYVKLGSDKYTYRISHSVLPSRKVYLKGFNKIDKNYKPISAIDSLFKGIGVTDSINHTDSGDVRINKNYMNRVYNNKASFWGGHSFDMIRIPFKNGELELEQIVDDLGVIAFTKDRNYSTKINKQLIHKDFTEIYSGKSIPVFVDSRSNRNLKWFIKELNLNSTSKANWRKIIELFIKIEEKLLNRILSCNDVIDYDNYKLDEKWYSDYAKANRKTADKRDTTKLSVMQRSYSTTTWETENYTLDEMFLQKIDGVKNNPISKDKIVIYTEKDNKSVLEYFERALTNNTIIVGIALAPRNVEKISKYVKDNKIQNVISYDEFLSNKRNIKMQFLRNLYKVYTLENRYRSKLNKLNDINVKVLFPKIGKIVEEFSNLSKELKDLSPSGMDTYFKRFNAQEKEVEEYVREKDPKFFKDIEQIEAFYNIAEYVLPDENTSYYYSDKKNDKRSFALFAYYFKPYNTTVLLNTELKVPNDNEILLILDALIRGGLPKEDKVLAEYSVFFYKLKNRLPIESRESNLLTLKENLKNKTL